jgi:hypothetical protein
MYTNQNDSGAYSGFFRRSIAFLKDRHPLHPAYRKIWDFATFCNQQRCLSNGLSRVLAPEKSKQDAESNYQRNQLMGCIETKVVIPNSLPTESP